MELRLWTSFLMKFAFSDTAPVVYRRWPFAVLLSIASTGFVAPVGAVGW